MKSYEEHLKTLLGQKPTHQCHRASSLFPVFLNAEVSMKLLFLNYWFLKRRLKHLLCRLYLRDKGGVTVFKKCFFVDEVRGYEIDLGKLVSRRVPFLGSIEIEFSSPDNLVFPYPAVVVHYEGKNFSTCVHAAQRTFNDKRDEEINSRKQFIESGFNIYADGKKTPFLTFMNGPTLLKNACIELAAYNLNQKVLESTLQLECAPYETRYFFLNNWRELESHLNGQVGCIKMQLPTSSIFPRLLVGNRELNGSMSVTHTYYDLSHQMNPSDYGPIISENWQAAALMVPLKKPSIYDTQIYFYPIYSPSNFWIDLEIYDLEGQLVKRFKRVYTQTKIATFFILETAPFIQGLNLNNSYSLKMIVQTDKNLTIPARIKVGLDVGFKAKGFPCNICTNFYPANPSLEQKPKAFRWAPLMPVKYSGSIWCHNDAPQKNYQKEAHITLTFYRSSDNEKKIQKLVIPPRGSHLVNAQEVASFLKEETGWCTFESDNPYITTYYFSEHPSKMIGGDHGF